MNQRKLGSIISYIQMIFGVVISLIYTPYMIQLLGQNEYGLYNTVASTISMMSVLSLGFNSSYIRYYSIYNQANDTEKIKKLNGLFLIVFVIIGIVAFACGMYLAANLQLVFKSGLTASEYALAKKLMILLTINLAISFPMSVFTNIISAHEKFVFLKLLGVVKNVCSPLITLPLLLAGYRSVAIAAVTMALSLFTDIIYLFYAVVKLNVRFIFHGFERGLFREIFTYTSFIAINIVVDQINWNIDKLLLARFKGTSAVAVYSVGYTLSNYYSMVSTAVSGVFTPLVHRIINESKNNIELQKQRLTSLFLKVGRVQFLILALFATGLVFFGKPFIRYWAGEGYEEAYNVALLLALPATIPLIQNVGIEIQRAENRHKFRAIVYLAMAVLNLVASVFLCQLWGATGSAIGTAMSLLVANGVIINIYYQKECNVDVIYFWKNIVGMWRGLLLPIAFGCGITIFVKTWNVKKMILYILMYIVVYCFSAWVFNMNQSEKELLKKPMVIIWRRMRNRQR